ncbi:MULTISPECIES: DUF4191 domain-containing protein [unclassified Pseudactinotalea]|uniref:DUF4191 domain-containing protein n=1 Tax=unclassified Pseudactinotalea TaxID=2649176 RepID=UPI00128E826E|nr:MULTISPECIES: DUF4191 domain-containing protein [unclassified Pseudactinotalea]MPV50028.1 DUF4191 family protein [Pseudactinotalea sp. HY160]QGH69493.1 DUF4191 family protein [Pseudactinotalea sp. HY158]
MAKKNATEPKAPKVKKRRWYHQVWEIFRDVRRSEPSITWKLLGIILGLAALGVAVGFLLDHPIYAGILGFMISLPIAMLILGRKAERHAYGRIEGQPGAVSAALGTIRRGWNIESEPVAVDPRHQDMVFRAVGRAGVVLVSEGPSHRVRKLFTQETRRVTRVVPNVPVIEIEAGRGEGQVPLPKIARAVQKQKAQLTKLQVAEVSKRLRALQQSRLPIPKGVDPMKARPDRKGMRGR